MGTFIPSGVNFGAGIAGLSGLPVAPGAFTEQSLHIPTGLVLPTVAVDAFLPGMVPDAVTYETLAGSFSVQEKERRIGADIVQHAMGGDGEASVDLSNGEPFRYWKLLDPQGNVTENGSLIMWDSLVADARKHRLSLVEVVEAMAPKIVVDRSTSFSDAGMRRGEDFRLGMMRRDAQTPSSFIEERNAVAGLPVQNGDKVLGMREHWERFLAGATGEDARVRRLALFYTETLLSIAREVDEIIEKHKTGQKLDWYDQQLLATLIVGLGLLRDESPAVIELMPAIVEEELPSTEPLPLDEGETEVSGFRILHHHLDEPLSFLAETLAELETTMGRGAFSWLGLNVRALIFDRHSAWEGHPLFARPISQDIGRKALAMMEYHDPKEPGQGSYSQENPLALYRAYRLVRKVTWGHDDQLARSISPQLTTAVDWRMPAGVVENVWAYMTPKMPQGAELVLDFPFSVYMGGFHFGHMAYHHTLRFTIRDAGDHLEATVGAYNTYGREDKQIAFKDDWNEDGDALEHWLAPLFTKPVWIEQLSDPVPAEVPDEARD